MLAAAIVAGEAERVAAAVGGERHRGGRLDDVGCRRAIMAGATQDLGGLSLLVGRDERVLSSLGRREVELLHLGAKLGDRLVLVLHAIGVELVDDRLGVGVHRVLKVAAALLELEGLVREALGHIEVHALDSLSGLAAAVGQLTGDRVGVLHAGDGGVVDGLLKREVALHHGVLQIGDLSEIVIAQLAQTLVDPVEALLGRLVIEAALDIAHRGTRSVAAGTTAVAPQTAATEAAEQGQDDDNRPPSLAEAIASVTVVPVAGVDNGNARNCRIEHCFLLRKKRIEYAPRDFLGYARDPVDAFVSLPFWQAEEPGGLV